MYFSIIITLLITFSGQFKPDSWISSETMSGKCYNEFVWLSDPHLILTAENYDSATMYGPYKKALNEYKKILEDRFGKNITDNFIFSQKWREFQAWLSREYCGDSSITADSWDLAVYIFFSFSPHPDFLFFWSNGCPHNSYPQIGRIPIPREIVYLAKLDSAFIPDKYYIKPDSGFLRDNYNVKPPSEGNFDMPLLIEDFNFWVDNSEDLSNMEPECQVSILLHIWYRNKPVTFVNSFNDLVTARSIVWAISAARMGADTVFMDESHTITMDFVNDAFFTDLNEFRKSYPKIEIYEKELLRLDSLYGFFDKYEGYDYHEPIFLTDNNTTSLTMTVFADNELVDWKFVFDKANHLISMDRVTEPIRE